MLKVIFVASVYQKGVWTFNSFEFEFNLNINHLSLNVGSEYFNILDLEIITRATCENTPSLSCGVVVCIWEV